MGLARAELILSNPKSPHAAPVEVTALADTGALHLCIPDHIRLQLGLDTGALSREVTTADGRKQICPYVGPVEVNFKNRICFVGALVLGDEVLLGAVPMEDMDLIVVPRDQAVIANPETPNIPASSAKKGGLN